MRSFLIFLVLTAVIGMAAGDWYPASKDAGPIKTDSKETNLIGTISIQCIGNITAGTGPEPSDDDQLFAAIPCNQTVNIRKTSFLAQPDYPRNIIATFNASTAGSIKITGTDISGAAITENLTVSGTSAASTKAFKTVTRIDADLASGQTNKTLKMGTGDRLALNTKLSRNTVIWAFLGNTRESTAPSVTTNSSVLSLNTADLSSELNSGPVWLYYIV
jgi:hypothetical protein